MNKSRSARTVRFRPESLERRQLLARTSFEGWDESNFHPVACGCGCRVMIPKDIEAISVEMDSRSATGDADPESTSRFNITLNFGSSITPTQQQYFIDAAAAWERVLIGDLPAVGAVDDVAISADVLSIDGGGGILGQAGPTGTRGASYGTYRYIPYQGIMQFDSADVGSWSASYFRSIVMHEMGHVLGVGTIWSSRGLNTTPTSTDPRYIGVNALAEYKALKNPAATSIPRENTGSSGTFGSHWRESDLDSELMTGYAEGGAAMPFSRITAASMKDLNYPDVNLFGADTFTAPSGNPLPVTTGFSVSINSSNLASLTVTGVNDANGIAEVQIYRETNGIDGLQGGISTSDTLVASLVSGSGTTYVTQEDVSSLPEGAVRYYAIARDTLGAYSAIRIANGVVNPTTVVPTAPSAPQLAASSDSGISNSDRITNVTALTFTGTAEVNAIVRLFADGIEVGQTTAAGGFWQITATTLPHGAYLFTATASNAGGESPASAATSVTIDTQGPAISAGAFAFEDGIRQAFGISESFFGTLGTGDVLFANTTTSDTFTPTVTYAAGVITLAFPAGLPTNGNYIASLIGTSLTDAAGNGATATTEAGFFWLNGDINRDRTVNFDDLLLLAQNYGTAGRTYSQGNLDLDASGLVEFSDLLILAQNYQSSVPAPLAATVTARAPAAATARRSSSGSTKLAELE